MKKLTLIAAMLIMVSALVFAQNTVDFTVDVRFGLSSMDDEQQTVHFSLAADAPTADTYLWDFGDGDTSIQSNPTHDYDGPGVYTVALQCTWNGSPDIVVTETKTDFITVYRIYFEVFEMGNITGT
ncbi:MAG: PKD domain-containing protein, partial [Candidatus Cloacimonetes bacterium]|nr:PKD domain-containing protein [Candidatus Cloacimonadota bacterium]